MSLSWVQLPLLVRIRYKFFLIRHQVKLRSAFNIWNWLTSYIPQIKKLKLKFNLEWLFIALEGRNSFELQPENEMSS